MTGNKHWTKAENLHIYSFLNRYTTQSDEKIANELIGKGWITGRSVGGVKEHIVELRKLESSLVVPDPVHTF